VLIRILDELVGSRVQKKTWKKGREVEGEGKGIWGDDAATWKLEVQSSA